MLDKPRLHALIAGAVVSALLFAMHMVPILFAEPPNTPRAIRLAIVTKGLAMVAAIIAVRISAPWAADLVNSAIAILPVKLAFKVDAITAAAVVAVVTMTLIADPTARQKVFAAVRSKLLGGAT